MARTNREYHPLGFSIWSRVRSFSSVRRVDAVIFGHGAPSAGRLDPPKRREQPRKKIFLILLPSVLWKFYDLGY